MSFISGVEDPCISAWSPKSVLPNYLITGSYEGVYSTGHERNVFDIYSLQNDELNKVTFRYRYNGQDSNNIFLDSKCTNHIAGLFPSMVTHHRITHGYDSCRS